MSNWERWKAKKLGHPLSPIKSRGGGGTEGKRINFWVRQGNLYGHILSILELAIDKTNFQRSNVVLVIAVGFIETLACSRQDPA